ncbi:UDP-N-acetylglucosamine--N-acetylmuramyl-(pentapeptide) pyrophosphoryl-undecaprenol N-acetylglucosamine transferase [Planctomonas psychrotolerans]|uniref:UDP-N-acetylglucosamine--N-acetylmuramyl- (pentapeptide) pyrophosphoryl-undecaprenol N-acetylglucosamine transferase n=1 Tax=Planctomonas psychrotolerans TaxID=2528712 RepID=UPI00123BB86E|nr:UDP-N-acetylglucosamine--N-acetylmuramyl-(pentapeptide) pyrophosphoryl-undecaprenol N-acetylglucosamine transferase [Planctomonas psychrotolerans]
MTVYLLAGGGTAGHVNPLLAVADCIRSREPESTVLVLGTREGLEARLVPDRGYELLTIPRLPFPRRANRAAARFAPDFRRTVATIAGILRDRNVDAVVGFGGYAAAPAYLAARSTRTPLMLHEANAKPGLANRLGARITPHVGVAFPNTPLRRATVVGMPLRSEITRLDREAMRAEALAFFGLSPERRTLLVTGGSTGARRLNGTVGTSAAAVVAAGFQVLHIVGGKQEFEPPVLEHYAMLRYCDRMDLAFAAADFAVSRAGAATLSELTALGIPAAYVPYPVGNGEQRYNAVSVLAADGGILVEDAAFTPSWVERELVPLLGDEQRLERMAAGAASVGVRDGDARMTDLIQRGLADRAPR